MDDNARIRPFANFALALLVGLAGLGLFVVIALAGNEIVRLWLG